MKTKQEIVDELKKKINDIENGSMIPFMSFEQGAYSAHNKDLKLIEQLAEPLKVKVPERAAEMIREGHKLGASNLEIISNAISFASSLKEDEFTLWFDKNEDIFVEAVANGYEVEEEPKYRVNIGGLYLKEPLGDTNDFTINMTWNEDRAYLFGSWNMAREHTSKLGGTVEKV